MSHVAAKRYRWHFTGRQTRRTSPLCSSFLPTRRQHRAWQLYSLHTQNWPSHPVTAFGRSIKPYTFRRAREDATNSNSAPVLHRLGRLLDCDRERNIDTVFVALQCKGLSTTDLTSVCPTMTSARRTLTTYLADGRKVILVFTTCMRGRDHICEAGTRLVRPASDHQRSCQVKSRTLTRNTSRELQVSAVVPAAPKGQSGTHRRLDSAVSRSRARWDLLACRQLFNSQLKTDG